MSIISRIIGKVFKLPPAETHNIIIERDVKAPMPDGVVLLADCYYPAPEKDDTIKVDVEMWPTAYRFARGHRVRLQVSSGAHPRFARNPGSGEPLATATTLHVADQMVYHDPAHPSTILLPALIES